MKGFKIYTVAKMWKYSEDMSDNQKDRFIQFLLDKVNEADLDNRAMRLVLEDFKASQEKLGAGMAELRKKLTDSEQALRETLERGLKVEARARKLEQQLKELQKY